MIVVKSRKNLHFDEIEKDYLNNFSYSTINEKIKFLKDNYQQDLLLEYFLTMINVDTVDHNIMKFLYPIFQLDKDIINKNISKIVENLNDSIIEFMNEYLNENLVNSLMNKYLESQLLNFDLNNDEDCKHLIKLFNKIMYPNITQANKNLSTLYEKILSEENIQISMVYLIKRILNNPMHINKNRYEILGFLLDYLDKSFIQNIENNIISFIKSETEHKKTFIYSLLSRKLLNEKVMISLINYLNHSELNSEVKDIFYILIHKKNFLNDKKYAEYINCQSFIKIAKSINMEEWVNTLKLFDELQINHQDFKDEFVSRITKSILKWQNLKYLRNKEILNYFLSILLESKEHYRTNINQITYKLTNYQYRIWHVSLKNFNKRKEPPLSNKPEVKARIVIMIGKQLVSLYGFSDEINDFVHYIIEDPYNSVLLQSVYEKVNVKKHPILEEKAKLSLEKILETKKDFEYNSPIESMCLLSQFLTAQNNEVLLNRLLSFKNSQLSYYVTKALGNSLF